MVVCWTNPVYKIKWTSSLSWVHWERWACSRTWEGCYQEHAKHNCKECYHEWNWGGNKDGQTNGPDCGWMGAEKAPSNRWMGDQCLNNERTWPAGHGKKTRAVPSTSKCKWRAHRRSGRLPAAQPETRLQNGKLFFPCPHFSKNQRELTHLSPHTPYTKGAYKSEPFHLSDNIDVLLLREKTCFGAALGGLVNKNPGCLRVVSICMPP